MMKMPDEYLLKVCVLGTPKLNDKWIRSYTKVWTETPLGFPHILPKQITIDENNIQIPFKYLIFSEMRDAKSGFIIKTILTLHKQI
ncbi:MAG: hypothetical protein ACXADY_07795 [Candidatus Hodarchaeales archaeon]|jgi:hypothetical protein